MDAGIKNYIQKIDFFKIIIEHNKMNVIWNKILIPGLLLFCTVSVYSQESRWSVQIGAGLSVQRLNWSVAGNEQGTSPNIFSELTWDKLRARKYNLQVDYNVSEKFGLNLLVDYNHITKGQGNDSDYLQDNRNDRFSNLDFLSNKGHVYDMQLKVNYKLPHLGLLIPCIVAGAEQIEQKLYILDLPMKNNGLRSDYKARWNGGTIGFSLYYPIQLFYFSGEYDFGLYDYTAKANWNLIETFQHPVSFRHRALGFKHDIQLKVGYRISERFDVNLSANRYFAFTNDGKDNLYLMDGGIKESRFNGVEFNQYNGFLSVRCRF